MKLRDYQVQTHMDARAAVADGHRSLLLRAPTGAGKTVIAANLIHNAEQKGSPCLFFAHRRELVYQCADKLKQFGVDHGIIMSGEFPDQWAGCQVASIDTFRARVFKGRIKWPKAKLVVIDEAHRSLSKSYLKVIEHYRNEGAIILGLTATPIRSDGRGLGHVYTQMVSTPDIAALIKRGYLVQPKHYAPSIPDLTGVRTVRGDYDADQLQEALDRKQLVGDIVTNWMRLARDRRTIVFATGVRHSISLRDEFLKAGIQAAHIDGNTPEAERDKIIRDLRKGLIQVICNFGVLTEGFDEPSLSACILARPTKNYGLYIQMAGRVLRPCEETGKTDALIIDHAGCVYRHGKVVDPYPWTLDMAGHKDVDAQKEQEVRQKTTITCENCNAVYSGQINCPECNHTPQRKGAYILSKTGDLIEVEDLRRAVNPRQWQRHEKVKWFNMFLRHAKEKGYKRAWAFYKFQDKFKERPGSDFPVYDHVELSDEFNAYVRYLNVKSAKAKEKAERERADLFG